MGSNGIVTETAHHNIDRKKFGDNYDRIFGGKKREKTEIEKLADKIASKHKILTSKAMEILETVKIELRAEVDNGTLAEEFLNADN